MAYYDLRDWISALDKAGELKRIKAEADPVLEIAEITDRVSKWGPRGKHGPGGPALLFENVKGYPGAKLLINQFGSERRMRLALDVDSLDEIADRIKYFMDVKSPQGLLDKIKMLPMLAEMGKFFPKEVSERSLQGSHQARQFLAAGFSHPAMLAAGRRALHHVAFGDHQRSQDRQTQCRHLSHAGVRRAQCWHALAAPETRSRALSPADASGRQPRARAHPATAALDMMARSGGGSRVAEGKQVAGKMDVAVAIGTDPAMMFSSIVPAPPDIEEYMIAGFLRQKPVELVKCETVDLEVPATSEIVLEGYVLLDELRMEGPFGDHTGFYTPEDLYPVFHVTCITHRKNPIYSTTIVGKPPMEDAWMGKAVERIFLPLMRVTIPEIVDVNLPIEGIFHNLMIVSIKKSYPGQARKVMNGIWSLGQAMSTKCILVVDEDVDVQDIADVTLKVLNHIDPERDIQFTLGPVDSLDHASRCPTSARKWASMPRASGRAKASRAPGPTRSAWTRRPKSK